MRAAVDLVMLVWLCWKVLKMNVQKTYPCEHVTVRMVMKTLILKWMESVAFMTMVVSSLISP